MIRPAALGDLPALVELEELLFGAEAWSAAQLTEELTGPHRRAWVAPADEPDRVDPGMNERSFIRGYAVTMTIGDIADLQRIGVHPREQRGGVARALLESATAAAIEHGADRMLLEVSEANTPALAFYTAAGFEEIDRRPHYYQDGADAIVMRRLLTRDGGAR